MAVSDYLIAGPTPAGFSWFVAGGLVYSSGTAVFLSRLRHAHEIWHVFVLAAGCCHFAAMFCYPI